MALTQSRSSDWAGAGLNTGAPEEEEGGEGGVRWGQAHGKGHNASVFQASSTLHTEASEDSLSLGIMNITSWCGLHCVEDLKAASCCLYRGPGREAGRDDCCFSFFSLSLIQYILTAASPPSTPPSPLPQVHCSSMSLQKRAGLI